MSSTGLRRSQLRTDCLLGPSHLVFASAQEQEHGVRQHWAICTLVLVTLVNASTAGHASNPAIPPTVEQMSGAWIGWMEDSQTLMRCEFRLDGTGACAKSWLKGGGGAWKGKATLYREDDTLASLRAVTERMNAQARKH
jgi:hypothetical protein